MLFSLAVKLDLKLRVNSIFDAINFIYCFMKSKIYFNLLCAIFETEYSMPSGRIEDILKIYLNHFTAFHFIPIYSTQLNSL